MRKTLTVTFLTIMFWAPALADQITLKNGDRLTGKIVKSDGGKLVIKTQLLGDVTVDLRAGLATKRSPSPARQRTQYVLCDLCVSLRSLRQNCD